ncbi:phage head-tail joining protein [Sphingomonas solaris]|uniref:Uncharacterized protein n=1 Tax=Alterirhizorhabdus solaris TaxID=2529389 RepID=A0A558R842_9SPHN|nr:hypothetical protein [Sphingomonas solaris]TVV75554.1 hypothetical protein FOY91_06750 [Sphingomonas solaris]
MAFTTADAEALRTAIATGAMKVRYADGREVTYRSLAEMREILRMIQADVQSDAGARCRTSVASF